MMDRKNLPKRGLLRLIADQSGAYMIEFALILPTFLMLMMGIFDVGVALYAKSVLAGSVEAAARASTLQANSLDQTAVDNSVRDAVGTVAGYATLSFNRTNYANFNEVNSPEAFTDRNDNGLRDAGECFEDTNNNGNWDTDRGANGQGGADDVVLYRVTMSYNRLFPLWRMLGQPQHNDITVSTVLRNQPFANQVDSTVVVC